MLVWDGKSHHDHNPIAQGSPWLNFKKPNRKKRPDGPPSARHARRNNRTIGRRRHGRRGETGWLAELLSSSLRGLLRPCCCKERLAGCEQGLSLGTEDARRAGTKKQRPCLRMPLAYASRNEQLLPSATGWARDVVHATSLRWHWRSLLCPLLGDDNARLSLLGECW